MKISTILFDLDGTLLPMDQDQFVKYYFGLLVKKLAPLGYDPELLVQGIWKGTGAMVKNDGSVSNEDAFWNCFNQVMSKNAREDEPHFRQFYENEFGGAQAACGFNPKAAEAVKAIKEKGFRVALATNPIFPAIATESRTRWAGLDVGDFEYFTAYENSRHCKPNPAYFQDVCDALGVSPEECLMVGNDAIEDTAAEKLGIRVFLLTDCLINKDGRDISRYPQGGFDDLLKFVDTL